MFFWCVSWKGACELTAWRQPRGDNLWASSSWLGGHTRGHRAQTVISLSKQAQHDIVRKSNSTTEATVNSPSNVRISSTKAERWYIFLFAASQTPLFTYNNDKLLEEPSVVKALLAKLKSIRLNQSNEQTATHRSTALRQRPGWQVHPNASGAGGVSERSRSWPAGRPACQWLNI